MRNHSINFPIHPDSFLKVLTVESRLDGRDKRTFALCRCVCGAETWVRKKWVVSGRTKSCGCKRRELVGDQIRTHGMRNTRAYRSWHDMVRRCIDPRRKHYPDYGGRGIAVCPEWRRYETFWEFIRTLLPTGSTDIPKGLTLDRIDNDRGYEPGNVRLATSTTQNRNRRDNRLITIDGVTRCLADWAEIRGVPAGRISQRIYKGWDPLAAVNEPLRRA